VTSTGSLHAVRAISSGRRHPAGLQHGHRALGRRAWQRGGRGCGRDEAAPAGPCAGQHSAGLCLRRCGTGLGSSAGRSRRLRSRPARVGLGLAEGAAPAVVILPLARSALCPLRAAVLLRPTCLTPTATMACP